MFCYFHQFSWLVSNLNEAFQGYLAAGTDINAKDGGFTPLHLAIGNKEIVQLLITKGADVNVRESQLGMTPLDMADDKGTADLLRKHGGKTGEELKAD